MVPAKVLPLKRYTNARNNKLSLPPEDGSENAKSVQEIVTTAAVMAAPRPRVACVDGRGVYSRESSVDV